MMDELGKRIKYYIKKNGMTQKLLAEKMHITQASMTRYINGQREPKASVIVYMAKVFGITTDELLGIRADEEVRSGEWIERDVWVDEQKVVQMWQSAKCSVCGRYHTTPYVYYFDEYEFCPHCGTKMK